MTMTNVIPLKTKSQKATGSSTDTIALDLDKVKSWKRPSFQRDIKRTKRFDECVEYIKANDGVLPGIITLGVLDGTGEVYKIDGNHRCECFVESGCKVGYADVRYVYGSMEDFAAEYSRLNEQISRTNPDDRLRAAAVGNHKIERLRSSCKVVSFSSTKRRGKTSVSMSSLLRAWNNACRDTPAARGKAAAAVDIMEEMDNFTLDHLINLINACENSFGREGEYASLWGQLNMTTVMWLYVQMVMNKPTSAKLRQLTPQLFEKCLLSVSADEKYVDWLRGRNASIHRGPCYMKVKERFTSRLKEETGERYNLPQPEWASR